LARRERKGGGGERILPGEKLAASESEGQAIPAKLRVPKDVPKEARKNTSVQLPRRDEALFLPKHWLKGSFCEVDRKKRRVRADDKAVKALSLSL